VNGTPPLLAVDGLVVSYGEARAVADAGFTLAPGAVLAVLGANGAGKSSLAAAVTGHVVPAAGRIVLGGVDVTGWAPHRLNRAGVAYVPEGRGIFPHLSVADNLRAMLRFAVPRSERAAAIDRAVELFPILGERRAQAAGTLSGGEQQMLALARVLVAPPRLLVADEMSLGLAPRLVDVVFDALARAKSTGVAVLLIEQYAHRALALADDALIMRQGVIAWSGPSSAARDELLASYVGTGEVSTPD
jgi:branched-chain amino acid transport system ATP-binding protein